MTNPTDREAADTPRTDTLRRQLAQGTVQEVLNRDWTAAFTEHSRQLERELAAANAERDRVVALHKGLMQAKEEELAAALVDAERWKKFRLLSAGAQIACASESALDTDRKLDDFISYDAAIDAARRTK